MLFGQLVQCSPRPRSQDSALTRLTPRGLASTSVGCADPQKLPIPRPPEIRAPSPSIIWWMPVEGTASSVLGTIAFLLSVHVCYANIFLRYLKNRKYNQSLKNVAVWGYWRGTGMYGKGTSRENAPYFEALSGTHPEHSSPTKLTRVLRRRIWLGMVYTTAQRFNICWRRDGAETAWHSLACCFLCHDLSPPFFYRILRPSEWTTTGNARRQVPHLPSPRARCASLGRRCNSRVRRRREWRGAVSSQRK